MKTSILSIIGVLSFTCVFGQYVKAPEGMKFVPSGSYSMTTVEKNDTIHKIISVQAFYMSDEITNKEYREFVNDIMKHPGDSLCRTICIKNTEIAKHIMDTTVFSDDKVVQEKYKHYFSDKAFDNYPVVGVSYKNALLYCLWKTKLENEKMQKKGEPVINDYRLPTEQEWTYAASQDQTVKVKNDNILYPVNKIKEGKYGLHNLSGNVSEWTSSSPADDHSSQKIIRGGSWRSGQNVTTDERKSMDEDTRTSYIGFRIIQTYLDNDR